MAISWVGGASANSGTGTSNTAAVTTPACQDLDVGVLVLATNGNATPTTPTGWTLIGTTAPNTLNEWHYRKTLSFAGDSGVSISVPLGSGFRWSISVGVYRAATFDASTPTSISNATATASPLQAAHTPTAADCMWVGLAAVRGGTTNVVVTWAGAPTGWTAIGSRTSASSQSTTTQNVGTAISDKQLSGQAGVSQTQTSWSITGNNGAYGDTGIMLAPMVAPAITSGNSTSASVGVLMSPFSVTTTGNPTAALSTSGGSLPTGVSFVDNGNGTATISGTPGAGTGGAYTFTITANNGFGSNATQSFTITVGQAPAITSGMSASGTVSVLMTPFTVVATGYPLPTLSKTGSLPAGVTFTDNGNGTATLAGTPATAVGSPFALVITAHNTTAPDATQNFTYTVASSSTAPGTNEELMHALQRCSNTTLDLDGAANAWAGTTGKTMLGALNAKNGSTGLDLLAVLNQLAGRPPGDIKWDVNGAAGRMG